MAAWLDDGPNAMKCLRCGVTSRGPEALRLHTISLHAAALWNEITDGGACKACKAHIHHLDMDHFRLLAGTLCWDIYDRACLLGPVAQRGSASGIRPRPASLSIPLGTRPASISIPLGLPSRNTVGIQQRPRPTKRPRRLHAGSDNQSELEQPAAPQNGTAPTPEPAPNDTPQSPPTDDGERPTQTGHAAAQVQMAPTEEKRSIESDCIARVSAFTARGPPPASMSLTAAAKGPHQSDGETAVNEAATDYTLHNNRAASLQTVVADHAVYSATEAALAASDDRMRQILAEYVATVLQEREDAFRRFLDLFTARPT